MSVAKQLNSCHICASSKEQGIWLVGGYICSGCLDEISGTEVNDPKYKFFIHKLKELWQTG